MKEYTSLENLAEDAKKHGWIVELTGDLKIEGEGSSVRVYATAFHPDPRDNWYGVYQETVYESTAYNMPDNFFELIEGKCNEWRSILKERGIETN